MTENLSEIEMIVSEYIHEIQFGYIGAHPNVGPFKDRIIECLLSQSEIDWKNPMRVCENFYGGIYSNFMPLERMLSLLGEDTLADIRASVLSVETPKLPCGPSEKSPRL